MGRLVSASPTARFHCKLFHLRHGKSVANIGLVCLLLCSWIARCECFKSKNLTIGGIFPMEGGWSGGVGCLPAVEMALEDINNRTDVLADYRLWMVQKDSQCMPGLGTKVLYELLYTPPTKTMVLSGCSDVSTFVAQAAKMWNLIVLGYGSSSPALSNRKRFPTFFRTHPSATIHNPTRVKLFQKFKWNRIATIQETLEVFQSTVEDLEGRVKAAGIDIVVRQSFLTDPTNAVKNLKRQDARIIVGVFYEDMARRVFCQVYKEKLYGKKYVWFIIGWYPDNWYANNDDNIDCTPEQMKEALEGHFTTEAIMLNKKPTVTRADMTSQQFKERLDKRLNTSDTAAVPGYPEAPLAYDAVWALALALDKVSLRLEKRGMKLEEFDYTNKEITDEIYSAMNSTQFLGVSGEVAFSSSGDRIAWTQVEQMIDGVYHLVGAYDYISDNLTWNNNEMWIGGSPPADRTRLVDFPRVVSPGVFFAMCGLATLGILAGIAALIFNIINRHRRLIAMSQPNVNNLMVCGCIMCLVCIYLLGLDGQFVSQDSYPHVCMARAWLLSFGFTFGYGSMFSKVWTVHRVTTLRKKNRKKVHVGEFYIVLVCIFIIDIVVLSTWQAIDPMSRNLEFFPLENPKDTEEDIQYRPHLEHCTANNLTVWLGITFGYKGVLLILGVFLAYETRSVKIKQINDSRFVGMSIYNVVVMCVITAPITLLINSQQNATFVFVSLAIILCSFLSIGLIFIPKVIQLIRHPHKEGIEIKSLSDSMASREEEERHQRLLLENEQLKQHISEREEKIRELNRRVRSKSLPKCVTIQTEESSESVGASPHPTHAPPSRNSCVVSFSSLTPQTITSASPDDAGVSIDADSGLASSSMAKSSKNSASDSEPYC